MREEGQTQSMGSRKRTKEEKLKSAAIVKMKYLMLTGKLDDGFRYVFGEVLSDLCLKEEEVEQYMRINGEELSKCCIEKK